ncbi:hypothetical protein [Actinoplanes sp. M2I2]|uniref:hypothetical protein n=1 Tax=Actinoplanes sp. M2I2 TaxID=1734444 RepID=UPI002021DAD9|nr:hypothetical protein [Actinoplanes sp. M2I2]
MLMHPDLMLSLANDRHRELVAESERAHLLAGARVARRARRALKAKEPTGNLASCERSVAVPAR